MSLLDPPAAKPEKSRAMAFTIAGDMAQAYQLWKPGPSYTMNDFLADWGDQGYYGPVKSYEIDHLRSPRASSSVAVTVKVSPYSPMPDPSDAEKSRKTRVVEVWILPRDKSFSFPP